jgi:hypothetical protein
VAARCPSLAELDVAGCAALDTAAVLAAVAALPALTRLDISRCERCVPACGGMPCADAPVRCACRVVDTAVRAALADRGGDVISDDSAPL